MGARSADKDAGARVEPRFLTLEDVARYLNVSVARPTRWSARESCRPSRSGGGGSGASIGASSRTTSTAYVRSYCRGRQRGDAPGPNATPCPRFCASSPSSEGVCTPSSDGAGPGPRPGSPRSFASACGGSPGDTPFTYIPNGKPIPSWFSLESRLSMRDHETHADPEGSSIAEGSFDGTWSERASR